MADVFISYAQKDGVRVAALAAALKTQGWSVWWDEEIRGGDEYAKRIQLALENARLVIVVWSADSVCSNWVKDEAEFARDRGILVPVSFDEVLPPLGFRQFQCTDLSHWDGRLPVPEKLVSAIAARLGSKPATVASAPQAAAWRGLTFGRILGAATAAVAGILIVAGIWVWHEGRQPQGTNRTGETYERESDRRAAPEIKSVAVLPFVALSEGKDDRYFADGLSEEIINALTTLPDLLVTARTSSFHFKGKDAAIPEIASMLGVAHVVEGSVRRSGDRVRITAQLIRASDGFHLWSQTYDRSMNDAFAVQTQIAESVAGAMGVLLDARQRAQMADAGVRNVEAFLAYQRGIELFDRAHNEGPLIPLLASANAEFETAIALSPDLAQAHFQHADLYAHLLIDEAPGKGAELISPEGITVKEAARRLVKDLDAAYRYEKDAGHRRVIKAVRTTVSSDWRSLKADIAQAYASWDNCRFGLWLDQTAILFGFGEQVHAHDLVRTRCDPLGSNWYRAAESAVWLGRPLEGLQLADRAEALQGRHAYVLHARVLADLALGRFAEAETILVDDTLRGTDVPEFMRLLEFQVPAAAGRAQEWLHLRRGLEQDPERLLVGAAVFGDRDAANRAAAAIDKMTLGPMILIRIADRCGCGKPFDLEATPGFARILRESDLPWAPLAPIKYPLKTW